MPGGNHAVNKFFGRGLTIGAGDGHDDRLQTAAVLFGKVNHRLMSIFDNNYRHGIANSGQVRIVAANQESYAGDFQYSWAIFMPIITGAANGDEELIFS